MELVIVESPFATNTITLANGVEHTVERDDNVAYARACLHDCLVNHGEAPFASHLLYTQEGVLDDDVPGERDLGIRAGLEVGRLAARRLFYVDRGFSAGMGWGLRFALEIDQVCEIRRIGGPWDLGWDRDVTLESLIASLRG